MPKITLKALRRLITGRADITGFKPTYNHDCLITNHWLTMDDKFKSAYQKAIDLGLYVDPHIEWRAHVACWAAAIGARLGGAFVECGVNRGFLSKIIVEYLGTTPDFFLLDTYEGFDPRYLTKTEKSKLLARHNKTNESAPWERGRYTPCYEEVINTFAAHPQVKIIKGPVPDTLNQVTAEKIAYLSLDMNCREPEIAALEYFRHKMAPGALVVIDDYGHSGHEEQRDAYDEYAFRNNIPLMSLPTGQGILLKTP